MRNNNTDISTIRVFGKRVEFTVLLIWAQKTFENFPAAKSLLDPATSELLVQHSNSQPFMQVVVGGSLNLILVNAPIDFWTSRLI